MIAPGEAMEGIAIGNIVTLMIILDQVLSFLRPAFTEHHCQREKKKNHSACYLESVQRDLHCLQDDLSDNDKEDQDTAGECRRSQRDLLFRPFVELLCGLQENRDRSERINNSRNKDKCFCSSIILHPLPLRPL